jgi:hypothetical protein
LYTGASARATCGRAAGPCAGQHSWLLTFWFFFVKKKNRHTRSKTHAQTSRTIFTKKPPAGYQFSHNTPSGNQQDVSKDYTFTLYKKTKFPVFLCDIVRMREIDLYFTQKEEPTRSCLLFLRDHVLGFDQDMTEAWKYRMPFYCYNGRMVCYLWVHKKHKLPYIGFVDGHAVDDPDLLVEKRARMKILLVDPARDVPALKIRKLLRAALKEAKSKG